MKDNNKLIISSALTAAISVGMAVASSAANAAPGDMEKCYGVVKAGKNDCGTAKHSCAAQATTDGDAEEWVYLPKGTCDKIVGGKTK